MINFINQMGIFGKVLIVIALYILVQIVRKGIQLFGGKTADPLKLEKGLHSIIFWGAVSAVLGVLAQVTGIYNALNAIIRAREISPNVIARGFSESFTTTMFGLTVLIISAIVWYLYLGRFRKMAAVPGGREELE